MSKRQDGKLSLLERMELLEEEVRKLKGQEAAQDDPNVFYCDSSRSDNLELTEQLNTQSGNKCLSFGVTVQGSYTSVWLNEGSVRKLRDRLAEFLNKK